LDGEQPELRRSLGLVSAIAVIVGGVIGSGIFMKPLEISKSLPSEAWIYGVWAGLGLVCLFGAFAYAELGAMLPEAGGQYAFLREGWGRFAAFLYGWCLFFVINTGTLAALAVAFGEWLYPELRLGEGAKVPLAVAMILGLAIVNTFGVKHGAAFQSVSTFAKLAALAAIVLSAFFKTDTVAAAAPSAAAAAAAPFALPGLVTGLVASAVAIFWAYEGWYQLPFNAAELKLPERDLPRGLVWGVLILIVTYVAANAAYFHVVPLEEMRTMTESRQVPTTVVERIFGPTAGSALAWLIVLSVLGAANPSLLSTPRAFYAMAKDGLFPRVLAKVHPRWQTPVVSIWAQTLCAIAIVVALRGFKDITEYVVFAALLFYGLTVASIYVLRKRRPDAPRPYRCWGYPVTPALFIAVVLFVDGQSLADPASQKNALLGLGILAVGAVAYFVVPRKRAAAAA